MKKDIQLMNNRFEIARIKYKPDKIKYLLIAESPPDESSNRFFYYECVDEKDSLFLETMKVLYPNDYTDAKTARKRKKQFLKKFKDDGFYLIDSTNQPVPSFSRTKKLSQIKKTLPILKEKINGLVEKNTKIILISSTVYEICEEPLKRMGFNIINEEMIDFPGSGGQVKYRTKMAKLLDNR